MNKKNNVRAQKTRKSIEEVFLGLLTKYEIQNITVREISKQAKINPSTFYAHYQDVYDLMEQIENRMSEEIGRTLWDDNEKKYKLKFADFFKRIQENKIFYRIYLNQMGKLIGLDKEIVEEVLAHYNQETRNEVEYHLEFFSAGVHAIIRKWLNNDCRETPEELAVFVKREYTFKNGATTDAADKFGTGV